MKRISILILALIISSCSSMESDADKVCDYYELKDRIPKLQIQVLNGDQKAKKELQKVKDNIDIIEKDVKKLEKKYKDNKEYEKYLSENCATWSELNEMDKFFEGLENLNFEELENLNFDGLENLNLDGLENLNFEELENLNFDGL